MNDTPDTHNDVIPGLVAPCGWCKATAGYRPGSRPYLIICVCCGQEAYLPTRADLDRIDAGEWGNGG